MGHFWPPRFAKKLTTDPNKIRDVPPRRSSSQCSQRLLQVAKRSGVCLGVCHSPAACAQVVSKCKAPNLIWTPQLLILAPPHQEKYPGGWWRIGWRLMLAPWLLQHLWPNTCILQALTIRLLVEPFNRAHASASGEAGWKEWLGKQAERKVACRASGELR